MNNAKLSPANIVILVGGVVAFIASFLAFNKFSTPSFSVGDIHVGGTHSYSAWSTHFFLIATIPALLCLIMALQVGLSTFAQVNLPDRVLGFSWDQIHLILGFQATIMMLAFLIQDTSGLDKGIGLFLMLIGAIACLVGAIMRVVQGAPSTPPSI